MATSTIATRTRARSLAEEEPLGTSTPAEGLIVNPPTANLFPVHERQETQSQQDGNSDDGSDLADLDTSQMTRGEMAETEEHLQREIARQEADKDWWESRQRVDEQIKKLRQLKREAAD